jgi:outer membrane protein OmpA-like peptidoglycan-associated protein
MSDAYHAPDPDLDPSDDPPFVIGLVRGRGMLGHLLHYASAAGLIILAVLLLNRCGDDDTDQVVASEPAAEPTDEAGSDDPVTEAPAPSPTATEAASPAPAATAAAAVIEIGDGATVRLSGTVADEAAHERLLAIATALAGGDPSLVVDELVVDPDSTTNDGGTLQVVGTVGEAAGAAAAAELGDAAGLEVDQSGLIVLRVESVTITLGDEAATLTGSASEATAAALVTVAGDLPGVSDVADALTIDDATTLGEVILVGTVPSEADIAAAAGAVADATGVAVDTAEVTVAAPAIATLSIGNGPATLTGTVSDDAARTALVDAVTAFLGDAGTVDDQTVVAGAGAGSTTVALVGSLEEASASALQAALADAGFTLDTSALAVVTAQDVAAELTTFLAANPIQFDLGSATISPASEAILDQVVAVLAANPELVLVVEGHTDDSGGTASNEVLSEQRAQAVVDYLVAGGVAGERLTAVGLGETEPIADNGTEEGRQQNRRIEFAVAG